MSTIDTAILAGAAVLSLGLLALVFGLMSQVERLERQLQELCVSQDEHEHAWNSYAQHEHRHVLPFAGAALTGGALPHPLRERSTIQNNSVTLTEKTISSMPEATQRRGADWNTRTSLSTASVQDATLPDNPHG